MRLFDRNKRTGGFLDEIRCDQESYLIWKWHPSGVNAGDGNRENAVRYGSSLRVKDGEVAVFVYHQKDGTMQDFIEGPYDDTIKTKNFPVLASIIGLAFEGGTPFQAEVYYINLTQIIQVPFAVPYFEIFDPRFSDFGVPVAVRGTLSFRISDYRGFIKLHRLNQFELDDFQGQIQDAVIRYVKTIVTNAPAEHNIPLIQIESKTAEINDLIEYDIKTRLEENFGVEVSGIDLGSVDLDKTDSGYVDLMQVTKEVTRATIEAETAAKVKNIADRQRVDIENYGETLRVQREETQYALHKQTQSSNLDAFAVEKQAEVGIAGAQALGQMGAGGAGNIDLGGGEIGSEGGNGSGNGGNGGGFNMAAIMASMAVGGAVGQNIAGTMNQIMSGNTRPINSQSLHSAQQGGGRSEIAPPPIPGNLYHVAVNGEPTGPFSMQLLARMVTEGRLDADSLVWKQGMETWKKAKTVEELKGFFPEIPPVSEETT